MELEVGKEYLVKASYREEWRILKLEKINKNNYRFEYSEYINKKDRNECIKEINEHTVKVYKNIKMYSNSISDGYYTLFKEYIELYNTLIKLREINEGYPDFVSISWEEINKKIIELKNKISDFVDVTIEDIDGLKYCLYGATEDDFDSISYDKLCEIYPKFIGIKEEN